VSEHDVKDSEAYPTPEEEEKGRGVPALWKHRGWKEGGGVIRSGRGDPKTGYEKMKIPQTSRGRPSEGGCGKPFRKIVHGLLKAGSGQGGGEWTI